MTDLLLLPGLLCDRTVWQAQVKGLADIARPRVVDYGPCDSFVEMAERTLAQAPARFALAGHSMGARVALEIMRVAPQHVERLALLDTGVHTLQPGETERRMHLVDLARGHGMEALCEAWLPPMVHADRLKEAAFMRPLQQMVARYTPDRFAGQIAALVNRPDPAPILPTITCPTLIGVGRQDAWSPPAQHEPIAAAIPGSRLVIFENAGHMAPYEAPDQVTDAMRDWLTWDATWGAT